MQGIEFQIVNDSAEAAKGLDELAKSLANLKTSLGTGVSAVSKLASGIKSLREGLDGIDTKGMGAKLKGLSEALANLNIPNTAKISSALPKNITSLNTAVSGVNSDKLNALASGLNAIGTVSDKAKVSVTLSKNITALTTALDGLKWTDGDKLSALADGLKPLTELGKQQIGPFITQLKKIPELVTELETVDMSKFKQQMEDLADAMKPFADEMQKASSGFSAFPSRIQKLITSTEQYNGVTKKAATNTTAWGNALKKISIAAIFRQSAKWLASFITRASDYQETIAMFKASMGEYAEEAYNYAQQVNEVMGINPAEWMQSQGVFQSIITGFGIAGDKAAIMSKNLTQLGYDLAAFYNVSFEDAMQKVRSGISGELEPLRNLGYDLSVARLQQDVDSLSEEMKNLSVDISDTYIEQERLSLGISKSVSEMTQAEKAQIRYHAMMTQLTQVQGAMARELDSPNNQLRILKSQLEQAAQAVGNIFIPIINKALPVLIAMASAIREIVSAIAALFGVQMADSVDWGDSIGSAAGATGDIADNMDSAAGSAKELKRYLAGFDELNVLPDQSSSGSGSGSGSGGSGFDLDPIDYDFLSGAVTEEIDKIKAKLEPFVNWSKENLEEIKDLAIGVGGIIGGWAISNAVISGVGKISYALKTISSVAGGTGFLALVGILADVNRFIEYINDISENGADFSNVSGAISELLGIAGDISVLSGHSGIGGALKVIQGIGEVVSACADMLDEGVNWDNVSTVVTGISNVVIGIGFIKNDWTAVGAGFSLQGFVTVIDELKNIIEAGKTGDWSNVSWVSLAIGAVELFGGLAVALGTFKNIKEKIGDVSETKTALETVTQSTETLSTGTSTMTTKMTDLVKNIGLGVAILAEVAAGAIIFVGAIAVLGWELGKVGEAWQPVIDNAATVATAVGVGTGLLVGIGVVCYALGTLGGTVALNIGIGIGILAELGVAAGLFIAEIWAIGKGLDEIGKAWQPVLNNSEMIITSIETGTGFLLGIGAVVAALGVVTIATGALLPAAILVGVGILEELGLAFTKLVDNLVNVSTQLRTKLNPELIKTNNTIPKLSERFEAFVEFIGELAEGISSYTKSMGTITWDSIVSDFRSLFARNPIKEFANDVNTIYTESENLNDKLSSANTELEESVTLLEKYKSLLNRIKELTSGGNTIEMGQITTNLKTIGSNIVLGLATGMSESAPVLKTQVEAVNTIYTTFVDELKTKTTNGVTAISTAFGKLTSGIQTASSSALSSSKSSLDSIISNLTDFSSSFTNIWGDSFNAGDATIVTYFSDIATQVETNLDAIIASLKEFNSNAPYYWGNTWTNFKSGSFRSSWNEILAKTETGLNSIIRVVNNLIYTLDQVSKAGTNKVNLTKVSVVSLPRFASGGFPDTGDLFIANEAGAEMVGSIGGRTAVANNDQIETAIENGVYRAVRTAMSEGSSSSGNGQMKVVATTVDGKVLFETLVGEARSDTMRTGYNRLVEV